MIANKYHRKYAYSCHLKQKKWTFSTSNQIFINTNFSSQDVYIVDISRYTWILSSTIERKCFKSQAYDTNYIFTSFYRIQGRWKILQKWEEITHILILPDQLSIDWMITMTMWWRYNMLNWKKFQILNQYSLPLLKMI